MGNLLGNSSMGGHSSDDNPHDGAVGIGEDFEGMSYDPMTVGSSISYNGVTINNVLTKGMRHTAAFDSEDQDYLGSQIVLAITGVVHDGYFQGIGGSGSSAISDIKKFLQSDQSAQALLTPKQDFVWKAKTPAGEEVVFEVKPSSATEAPTKNIIGQDGVHFDVEEGPKPKALNVVRYIPGTGSGNAGFFEIEYEIQFTVFNPRGGPSDHGNGGGTPFQKDKPHTVKGSEFPGVVLVSNKYSVQQTMDDRFYTILNYSGEIRRQGHFQNPPDASTLQKMFVEFIPCLYAGFARSTISWTQSKDGMTWSYTFTDKEVYAAPPNPASKWGGEFTCGLRENGTFMDLAVSVTLEGDPGVNPGDLLLRAFRVAFLRLGLYGSAVSPRYNEFIIDNISFTEKLADNTVSVEVQGRRIVLHKGADGKEAEVAPCEVFYKYVRNAGQKLNQECDAVSPDSGTISGGPLENYDAMRNPIGPYDTTENKMVEPAWLVSSFRSMSSGFNIEKDGIPVAGPECGYALPEKNSTDQRPDRREGMNTEFPPVGGGQQG